MKLISTYSVKIKHYNAIFRDTLSLYRQAVDFFIDVALKEWDSISLIESKLECKGYMENRHMENRYIEKLCHKTKQNPTPKYEKFDMDFYKFPSYLRRSAIADALGKVSSYKSNFANWKQNKVGKKPGYPKAGHTFPVMCKDNMYNRLDDYTAQIKVFTRNTWDYITVNLKKSDVDYIKRHCSRCKELNPTLLKKGKEWFLAFPFEEKISLNKVGVFDQKVLAVHLGINNACTCSVVTYDGTVIGRHMLNLPREKDSLNHALNKIKQAQQHGSYHNSTLWARANGINLHIANKTVSFIMELANRYKVDMIVFEHLDTHGKKRGSKKQMLHLWKKQYVQKTVEHQAHRNGIRISHVNAYYTSQLAFDGSGKVKRGKYTHNGIEKYNYSMCVFQTGKTYNCDLNASYNIGARYFIREILKSLSETIRLDISAKVPECSKRTTCTLSTLIKLNVGLLTLIA